MVFLLSSLVALCGADLYFNRTSFSYSVKNVGAYTITAEYNGQKVSNKIVIKPTLTAKNISKKKAKKIKFSVKLVNKNGKALNKKKITFKINGKTLKSKTNSKGIATVSLKNLKVGKNVIYSTISVHLPCRGSRGKRNRISERRDPLPVLLSERRLFSTEIGPLR